jgi:hypothetical protein
MASRGGFSGRGRGGFNNQGKPTRLIRVNWLILSKARGGFGRGKPAPPPTPLPQLKELDSRLAFDAKGGDFDKAKKEALSRSEHLQVHAIRPGFADKKRGLFVATNHFAVTLPELGLHQYTVIGMEDEVVQDSESDDGDEANKPSRARKAALMDKVMQVSVFLGAQRQHFVTDQQGIIISWKDLSAWNGAQAIKSGEILEEVSIVDKPATNTLSPVMKTLEIVYNGKIPVRSFAQACTGNISALPLERNADLAWERTTTITTPHAINIILSETARRSGQSIFQVGAKKTFLLASRTFLEPGVSAYKGFFSSVKYGMGVPLLNISTATSAFYDAERVDNFIRQYVRGDDALKVLKGVEVLIFYQENRQKIIKEFGKPPGQQMFKTKEGGLISVLEHLRTKNSLPERFMHAIKETTLPCASLGDRVKKEWFPVEALTIVQHQLFRPRWLSANAADAMLSLARDFPGNNRQSLVRDGLRFLGIS